MSPSTQEHALPAVPPTPVSELTLPGPGGAIGVALPEGISIPARSVPAGPLTGWRWVGLCATFDFALVAVAVLAVLAGAQHHLPRLSERWTLLLLPLFAVALLAVRGVYRRRLRVLLLDWLPGVFAAVSIGVMAVAMLDLLIDGRVSDGGLFVRVWALALVMTVGGRVALARVNRRARTRRRIAEPVLILGAGIVGSRVARRLQAHPEYGLTPAGFLDDDPLAVVGAGLGDLPVLGTLGDLERTLHQTGSRTLIVAFSSSSDARVNVVIRRCHELGVHVSVVPRMFDSINDRIAYESLGGLPLLSFGSVDPRGWQFALKHVFDRAFAAMMLLALSVPMALIAAAVKLTSPGPVLFRQRRVGRDGRVFDLLKFRSMYVDPAQPADENLAAAGVLVVRDTGPGGVERDKRLTPIGGLLRKLSLDELPQFINVLRGDMSVIGPRPERPDFAHRFSQDIDRYEDRHRVKSGITGWAQVHGLRGPTSLTDRTEWDNYYIAHWSPGLDLRILLLTAAAVFKGG